MGYFYRCSRFCLAVLILSCSCTATALEPTLRAVPELKLAKTYHSNLDLKRYLVSEKYDGVRAYWNGHTLVSRRGHRFYAPAWFTQDFGAKPLDGELWLGRGKFDQLSGIVRRHIAQEPQWAKVKFMVFDLPASTKVFSERYIDLVNHLHHSISPYISVVLQHEVVDEDWLMQRLEKTVATGGEGLMLQKKSAYYQGKRSDDLIKLKKWQDAEAVVIAHLPGKGKYVGMLGALLVETTEGVRFKIGSGFSNLQRKAAPPIGVKITYKFVGKSAKGVPRFASFLRVRSSP
jgi:DNA ligase-1